MIFWALRIENRAGLTHFWPQKMQFFAYMYLYVDNVDKIFIRIRIFAHMRIIRLNRIFRIRMAYPTCDALVRKELLTQGLCGTFPKNKPFQSLIDAFATLGCHMYAWERFSNQNWFVLCRWETKVLISMFDHGIIIWQTCDHTKWFCLDTHPGRYNAKMGSTIAQATNKEAQLQNCTSSHWAVKAQVENLRFLNVRQGPRHDICQNFYATNTCWAKYLRKKRVNRNISKFATKVRKCFKFMTNTSQCLTQYMWSHNH